ncbi:DUF1801 domain-containing protein [Pedobacter sp. Du54]|uniref:DUF1801 domain-containing protein n=1 Tax=Pedobacter anseongensis TaxID=3133439 RepID=UPI0030B3452F
MSIKENIEHYIKSIAEPKRTDLYTLHELILNILPSCKLWFLDGKDDTGKIVSNPNIGYGFYTIHYADKKTKVFYRIGLSANSSGISIYILGIDDKEHLKKAYGDSIGKASVTGYCIKFKKLSDINLAILEDAIRFGFEYNHDKK